MPKRSGFKSSIKEFLTKSNDEILGELTKFQEGSVETTQRDAWQDQIDLLKDILPNFEEGYILFEFKIPRIGKRVNNIANSMILHSRFVHDLQFPPNYMI